MRRPSVLAWYVGISALLVSGVASARAPFSSNANPSAFFEAFKVLYAYDAAEDSKVTDPTQAIPPYLAESQCGGYDLNDSVNGKISTVRNMPGHEGIWDGDKFSGMGVQLGVGVSTPISGYIFPANTDGRSTACGQYGGVWTTKNVWRLVAGKLIKVEKEFQNPSFQDPACRWHNAAGPAQIVFYARQESQPFTENATQQVPVQWDTANTPGLCGEGDGAKQGFKDWTNEFTYIDCKVPGPPDKQGNRGSCLQWCERYTCTDSWNENTCFLGTLPDACEPSCRNGVCDPGENSDTCFTDCPRQLAEGEVRPADQAPNPADKPLGCFPDYNTLPKAPEPSPNSVICTGEECRCPRKDGKPCTLKTNATIDYAFATNPNQSNGGWTVTLALPNAAPAVPGGKDYESYYRKFQGDYSRDTVAAVPSDVSSQVVTAGCYGFYNEFDPKTQRTLGPDRRCVINVSVSEFRNTQTGKGTYATLMTDVDPLQNGNQRNGGNYNADADLWQMKMGPSFSLISPKKFKDTYDSDLTRLLLDQDAIDNTDMRPSVQVPSTGLARSSYIRAFDDTGSGRSIVSWWQKQQTEAAALLHTPIVILILPTQLAKNIALKDPLFAALPTVQRSLRFPQSETVELQLFATEDLLGQVFAYLENSLLPLQEEQMPVVIPLASPVEISALRESWCTWFMTVKKEQDCAKISGKEKEIYDRLGEYMDAIEDVRSMRGALYDYAGSLLDLQRRLNQPIVQWIKGNQTKYNALVQQKQLISSTFEPSWNQLQTAMSEFHEKTNAPWCMNQRYTTPVYSLLDEWLPARVEAGSVMEQGTSLNNKLSSIEEFIRPKDIVIDLTHIRFLTGAVRLPVLKPIQVAMELPHPPSLVGATVTPAVPPSLPNMTNIQSIVAATRANLPKISTGAVINYPSPLPDPIPSATLDRIFSALSGIDDTIFSMSNRYSKFWESIGPLKPQAEWRQAEINFASKKQRLECMDWDDVLCQHVEMDLLQRVRRIGSRPDVQLREDYDSYSIPRSEPVTCIPAYGSCIVAHPMKTEDVVQWNMFMRDDAGQTNVLNTMRDNLRNATLMVPVGSQSSSAAVKYGVDWKDLIPGMENPPTIKLNK